MKKLFKTSDIVLAAVLKTLRVPMVRIIKDSRRSEFEFDVTDPEDFDLINEFQLGNIRIEPVIFYQITRQLISSAIN